MKILVTYATTEGQTRKIAGFIVSELKALGHSASLQDARSYVGGHNPEDFDALILAGSVHQNRHQEVLGDFIEAHRQILESKKTLLVSVSLSAAFENMIDEAEGYVEDFCKELEWRPDSHILVAGAIKHGSYGYYEEMILQHRVLPTRPVEQPDQDQELTDWDGLRKEIARFVS